MITRSIIMDISNEDQKFSEWSWNVNITTNHVSLDMMTNNYDGQQRWWRRDVSLRQNVQAREVNVSALVNTAPRHAQPDEFISRNGWWWYIFTKYKDTYLTYIRWGPQTCATRWIHLNNDFFAICYHIYIPHVCIDTYIPNI